MVRACAELWRVRFCARISTHEYFLVLELLELIKCTRSTRPFVCFHRWISSAVSVNLELTQKRRFQIRHWHSPGRGVPPGGAVMAGKKKGNEDAAEECPGDMAPEMWAIVGDVNALILLAGKKEASPVSRFSALCHLMSKAASSPKECDTLITSGALFAALSAVKPDVTQTDRTTGWGLLRCLLVGAEGAVSFSPNLAALEECAEGGKLATYALQELISGSSPTAAQHAIAVLLALVRHDKTRQSAVSKTRKVSGAWESIAKTTMTNTASPVARLNALQFFALVARHGDCFPTEYACDEASDASRAVEVVSEFYTNTKALEFLLDAACDDETEPQAGTTSVVNTTQRVGTREQTLLSLKKEKQKLLAEDIKLSALECLTYVSRKWRPFGKWLFAGHAAPRLGRLVRSTRLENTPPAATLAAVAVVLFNSLNWIPPGGLVVTSGLTYVTASTASLDQIPVESGTEKTSPRFGTSGRLPGGFGDAARSAAIEKKESLQKQAGAAGSLSHELLVERLTLLVEHGALTPLCAVLSKAGVLSKNAAAARESGPTRTNSLEAGDMNRLWEDKEKTEDEADAEVGTSPRGEPDEEDKDTGDEKENEERENDAPKETETTPQKSKNRKSTRKSSEKKTTTSTTLPEKRRAKQASELLLEGKRCATGLFRCVTSYLPRYSSEKSSRGAVERNVIAAIHDAGGFVSIVKLLKSEDAVTKTYAQAVLWNVANTYRLTENIVSYPADTDLHGGTKTDTRSGAKKPAPGLEPATFLAVPKEHLEFLRLAKAPRYVTAVAVYGEGLEKLALRRQC